MENALEKMPAGASEEEQERKNGEAVSNEQKEQSKEEARRRLDDILDKIQHYIDFLNETETAKKLMSKCGFEYSEAESVVEKNLASLAEDVNNLVADKKAHLTENSSLADIVGNSVMGDLGLVMRQIKNVRQTVKQGLVEGKINIEEYKTKSEKSLDELKKFLKGLESSLDKTSYYVKTICGDDEKLKMELSRRHGYLENFEEYFYGKRSYFYDKEGDVKGSEPTSEKAYPAGVSKVAYFRFFNEWEQENVKQENLEKELGKLDDKFIDKGKIREDFKEGREPRSV